MIKLIVALDKNNLIGNDSYLPWKIKKELAFFKKVTLNHNLIMGRKTFVAIPNILEKRKIYVFGRQEVKNAYKTIKSLEELENLFRKFTNSQETLFIAGGKFIYEKFYKRASEIIVSRIKNAYKGNVYLKWDLSTYKKDKILEEKEFNVYKYTKI